MRVSRIHYDQAHEQSNKTIKSIKGPTDFLNRASDELQRRWEIAGSEIAEYLEQLESKILQAPTKRTPITMRIILHTRKDYTIVIGRLLPVNPFLEDSFIKVGTDIAYSEEVCAFVDVIPEIGQKQYKGFVDTRLIRCKKLVFDTITKNNFVTLAKSTAKADPKKTSTLKESDLNKLRAAALFRPSLCAEVFKREMTGLPECCTKKQQMYHGNKSKLLKIFDPTPSLTSTLKNDVLILDFSAIASSQVAFTTAKIFNEFADGIIEFVKSQSSGCSRMDIL